MTEKEYNKEDIKKELNKLEKGDYLKTYIKHLKKQIKNFENEKYLFKNTLSNQDEEIRSLKREIDRFKDPPLVGAVIIDILDKDKGKVVVQSGNGPIFVVNSSQKVNKEDLKPGTIVALNQRTFAVMEIIPITSEQIKYAREKVFLTEYTWKQPKPDN